MDSTNKELKNQLRIVSGTIYGVFHLQRLCPTVFFHKHAHSKGHLVETHSYNLVISTFYCISFFFNSCMPHITLKKK